CIHSWNATVLLLRFKIDSDGIESVGNKALHLWVDGLGEGHSPALRAGFVLPWDNRRRNANQPAIGSVQADRVCNQVKLGPVLATNGTAMRLVPVQDQQPAGAFTKDVAVNLEGFSPAGQLQGSCS